MKQRFIRLLALIFVLLFVVNIGYVFAFANCGLFVLYVMLGHRIAGAGGSQGIDRLGVAMLIASSNEVPGADPGLQSLATASAARAARSAWMGGLCVSPRQ